MRRLANPNQCVRSDFRITQLLEIGAAALLVVGLLAAAKSLHADDEGEFNQPGNYLIADQFNNRVIEVAPNGRIVWQFGLGPKDFSPNSIIGTNDAQRVGSLTLMDVTGDPSVPNLASRQAGDL